MHTDPIADLLTRIRNAVKAEHSLVHAPYSKIKENILSVLKENGFVDSYEKTKNGDFDELTINISKKTLHIRRISKPGQRIYIKRDDIGRIRSGLGINIISTSKGIMTGDAAKKQNIGGELICEVY